jgi:hypothetical protein
MRLITKFRSELGENPNMINRIALLTFVSTLTASAVASAQDGASKAAADAQAAPEPGVVITSEGLVEKCILPLVVTKLDGEDLEEDAGRYEFESGSHSFSGYSQGDFSACATIATAGLGADSPIGEGSTTVTVPAGKEYYLGLDVRKSDPATWKIVTWRINH